MVNIGHKNMLSTLIIREMQIKTAVRDHLTAIRLATLKKKKKQKQSKTKPQTTNDGKDIEKKESSCTADGNRN